MHKKEVWQCDYCRKTYANKAMMKKHESICFYNPENKGCGSCMKEDHGTHECEHKPDRKGIINCFEYINRDEFMEELEMGEI